MCALGSQKASKKAVQFSETHVVEETGEVQKPAAVLQQPAKQVQESTEAAAATSTVAESKHPHEQVGELPPATKLTHHLDALFLPGAIPASQPLPRRRRPCSCGCQGDELFWTDDFNGLKVDAKRIDALQNMRCISPCQAYMYYSQWYALYGDADIGSNGDGEHGPAGNDDSDPG